MNKTVVETQPRVVISQGYRLLDGDRLASNSRRVYNVKLQDQLLAPTGYKSYTCPTFLTSGFLITGE